MKNIAIIISIMFLGISNINLIAKPSTDTKIEVCDGIDISQIATILDWSESQIETESLSSSSNQRNGVCRYVHGDEDLLIIVKEKNKSQEKGRTYRAFGTVEGAKIKGSNKSNFQFKNTVEQYEVELNYRTEKSYDDAYELMRQITALVSQL
jgi:hypothetical protein